MAATQKIALGPDFAMMMYVWCPDGGEGMEAEVQAAVGRGATVSVRLLCLETVGEAGPAPSDRSRSTRVEEGARRGTCD